jgi:hypothetical protein
VLSVRAVVLRATSRTLRAWATCSCQPAAASVSRTQIAPLIISTTALNLKTKFQHKSGENVLVGRHRSLADQVTALAQRTPRRPSIRPVDPEILRSRTPDPLAIDRRRAWGPPVVII